MESRNYGIQKSSIVFQQERNYQVRTSTNKTKFNGNRCDQQITFIFLFLFRQIEFGRHEARHLVVVGHPTSLVVWDILTFRVKWNVPLKLSTLSADPLSSYMAAFTTDNTRKDLLIL